MLEFAGVLISGVSLLSDLMGQFKDLATWEEDDLLVDGNYLPLALARGHLQGGAEEFTWSREEAVPTRELRGTHRVVIAFNAERKVKYRICQGRPDDRLILMRKTFAEVAA